MENNTADPIRVAVLGTGPIGLGCAAMMLSRGHDVVAWSPRRNLPAGSVRVEVEGVLQQSSNLKVAATCAEAVSGAAVVLVAVPGAAYEIVLSALGACIKPKQSVIISSHIPVGAIFLSRLLASRGIPAYEIPILAWGGSLLNGTADGCKVSIRSIRSEIDVAAVPKSSSMSIVDQCSRLFGNCFYVHDGLMAAALSNDILQKHLALALYNLPRMKKSETWNHSADSTAAVTRLIEALDDERLAVADAFGIVAPDLWKHRRRYSCAADGSMKYTETNHVVGGGGLFGVPEEDSPHELEMPFSLAVMVLLGQVSGRPMKVHEAGLEILSEAYGRDFASENDILPALGLERMNGRQLCSIMEFGWGQQPEADGVAMRR